jgi:hypothetical protein
MTYAASVAAVARTTPAAMSGSMADNIGAVPRLRLILFRPQHLSGFQVDKVRLRARQACDRLIRGIVIGHFIGGPSLHGLGGVRAAIEKGRCHQ